MLLYWKGIIILYAVIHIKYTWFWHLSIAACFSKANVRFKSFERIVLLLLLSKEVSLCFLWSMTISVEYAACLNNPWLISSWHLLISLIRLKFLEFRIDYCRMSSIKCAQKEWLGFWWNFGTFYALPHSCWQRSWSVHSECCPGGSLMVICLEPCRRH
jgi:hypothetical protein